MAYQVDWTTKVVTIPQADLTLVSAGIYELNVLTFWSAIHAIQSNEGIPYIAIMRSNAPVTISGVVYARSVEVVNGYTIEFEDGQYQVNLVGANNNILDTRVQNQVSINPSNSAGLQVVTTGSGVLPSDITDIKNAIFAQIMEDGETFMQAMLLVRANAAGDSVASGDNYTIKSKDGLKDRVVSTATAAGRTITSTDVT